MKALLFVSFSKLLILDISVEVNCVADSIFNQNRQSVCVYTEDMTIKFLYMIPNGNVIVTCYGRRQFVSVCAEGCQPSTTSGLQLCAEMTEYGVQYHIIYGERLTLQLDGAYECASSCASIHDCQSVKLWHGIIVCPHRQSVQVWYVSTQHAGCQSR